MDSFPSRDSFLAEPVPVPEPEGNLLFKWARSQVFIRPYLRGSVGAAGKAGVQ